MGFKPVGSAIPIFPANIDKTNPIQRAEDGAKDGCLGRFEKRFAK